MLALRATPWYITLAGKLNHMRGWCLYSHWPGQRCPKDSMAKYMRLKAIDILFCGHQLSVNYLDRKWALPNNHKTMKMKKQMNLNLAQLKIRYNRWTWQINYWNVKTSKIANFVLVMLPDITYFLTFLAKKN